MKLCLSLFGRAALRIKSWLFHGNFYMTVWLLKKTMIMKGQDIYSSQDEVTTSPSSSESQEAKGEESSEEIDSQEERDLFMVRRLLGGQIDAIKLHLYCCSIFFLHPCFCVFSHSFIVAYKLFKKVSPFLFISEWT